jgi:Tfp pilus assembly protein FimV
MILGISGLFRSVARRHIGLSALMLFMVCSADGAAKDAVHFSRVGSPDAEGIVHFAANKPALAALQREMAASEAAARTSAGARPGEEAMEGAGAPRPVLRARGSGQRNVDGALAQLLRGFAVLEGELARTPLAGNRYRVQPGDTLDEIIFKTLGDLSVRHQVVRDAFIRANPRAFRRKNPNYLLAGVELRIPGAEDFRAVVFDDPQVGQTIDRRRMIRYP